MAKCYACSNLHEIVNNKHVFRLLRHSFFLFDWLSGSYLISNGSYLSDDNYLISVITWSLDSLAIGVILWQNNKKIYAIVCKVLIFSSIRIWFFFHFWGPFSDVTTRKFKVVYLLMVRHHPLYVFSVIQRNL